MTRRLLLLIAAGSATGSLTVPQRLLWGEAGHRITAQAAVAALPTDMPQFFREAGPQLAYLNPEPDRWRAREESQRDPALEGATAPDHFLDLELIPAASRAGALAARDRYAFADSLRAHRVDPATAGALPFAIVEVTQRLRVAFRLWRKAPNDTERRWIEARIINDAGILGHYVADGSNPAHTTIHYNGWVGANPNGYATDNRFHGRFESAFVQTRVKLADVQPQVSAPPQELTVLRPAVVTYFLRTHADVERLYQLDKASPFNATQQGDAHKAFAVERLVAGATMLRDLWWTAWVTSAPSGG
ncbi:MAG: nuclease [Gemmatimonadota bacterium]